MKPLGVAALAAALIFVPLAGLGAEGTIVALADAASPPSADIGTPSDGSSGEAPSEEDIPGDQTSPFVPGEQTIGMSIGAFIPVFMISSKGELSDKLGNLYTGGAFSFSYQYFVANGFAIGGNFSGAFNSTIGGLSVFTAPLGFTAAYWWTKLPLEFCVLGEVGGYLMRYSTSPSQGVVDPFAKVGAGAYWRITPAWSVGIQANFWFVPEIHYGDYAYLTEYAGFVETSISAVYHL
jgi:hypothetical protein